jgi:DNA invertase Pin-like site-specific DNA recombinase
MARKGAWSEMARKSRYAEKEAAVNAVPPALNAAGYVRLSNEDIETESIENQELMVRKYIERSPDMSLTAVFSDNGLTGTDFHRPGFEALMDAIRGGKVNCVVVKDLSRFGRDYIETGNYIETIFPQMGIRFISIGDDFDSADPRCREDGMSVALKNIINAAYVKDLAVKMRTAWDAKMRRGDYTGAHPPFGYMRLPGDKTKLVIDEEAAEYVRMMYRWRTEGATLKEIAGRLDGLGVPNPAHYAYLKGRRNDRRFAEPKPWEPAAINDILENCVYIGNLVQGKHKDILHKRYKQPKEDWVYNYGTHEPIVSRDDFDKAAAIRQSGTERRKELWAKRTGPELPENIFKGLLFCGECGYSFNRSTYAKKDGTRKIFYTCLTCQKRGASQKNRWMAYDDLYRVVFESIMAQVRVCADHHAIAERLRQSDPALRQTEARRKEAGDLCKRISAIENRKERLLCDLYDGILSRSDYEMISRQRSDELTALSARLAAVTAEQEPYQPSFWDRNLCVSAFERFQDPKELTREMLETLVERIEVGKDLSVRITFRYRDEFAALAQFLKQNGRDGNG